MNSTTKIIAGVAVLALLFAAVGYAAVDYKGSTSSDENVAGVEYVTIALTEDDYSGLFDAVSNIKYNTANADGTITYTKADDGNGLSAIVPVVITGCNAGETVGLNAYYSGLTDPSSIIAANGIQMNFFSDAEGTTALTGFTNPVTLSEDAADVVLGNVTLTGDVATIYCQVVFIGVDTLTVGADPVQNASVTIHLEAIKEKA